MATGIEGRGAGAGLAAARRPRPRIIRRAIEARPATLLFAAAAAVSAGVLLLLGSRLTFLLDDWEFLVYRRGFNADAILLPHGENIAIGPVLVYKALLASLGMDSAFPFRVVSTAAFIASVALLFVYLRRRVGEWPALAGAIAILFLGAAWEDLLWPFQVGYFVSMAGGLGMLLALERQDAPGDRLACCLLTVSIAFSSLGLPFVAGAAAAILLGSGDTWRSRAYVVAIPVALFAIWWLGWGHEADTEISAANIATAPVFMFDGLAGNLSSLLGLATPRDETGIGPLDWGRPLLIVALALAAWRLWRLGRVPRGVIVVVAIAAAFWLLAGINEKPGRDPIVSRYQYVGAIFVLLIAAELLRGVRIGRLALVGIYAATALAVASNLSFLHQSYRNYKVISELERADLAAVEIARDRVDPGFVLTEEIARTAYVGVQAGPYLSAADAFGSPAYTEDELAAAPEYAREAADVVLANAIGVALTPVASSGRAPTCAPGPLVEVGPGETLIEAPADVSVSVRLRRFADDFAVVAGEVPPGKSATLSIPADRSSRLWQLQLESSAPAPACATPVQ